MYDASLKDAALAGALAATAAEVVIVRSTQVTESMLDAGEPSLIVRAGTGVNTIDVRAAARRGVDVANCPGRNSIAVAERAFGLILALDRRIPDNVSDLRAGRWNKKKYSDARGLYGRRLGLRGFGSIGQEVARRANAFGMDVLVWSRRFLQDGAVARAAIPRDIEITVRASMSTASPTRIYCARSPEEIKTSSDFIL